MNDETRTRALEAGDLARSPTGRLCRVIRVDHRRDEADVEVLAHRMTLRTSHLRPLPAGAGEDAEDGDGPALY